MRNDSLPSPGLLSMGINLQSTMARAISAVEIAGMYSGGKTSLAAQLDKFLVASRAAIAAFIDATVPTVLTRTIEVANVIRVRISTGLDPKFVPVASAFAITGVAKVVKSVAISGPDLIITVTVPFVAGDAPSIAYTQPGALSNARDLSGNLLASFLAAVVTNTLV